METYVSKEKQKEPKRNKMKKSVLLIAIILTALVGHSQTIYSKAYGDPSHEALIFLHGGPGYNAIGFEATTASILADNGFYVVVYDRRGEGRSLDANAKFTFQETFDDLNGIYEKYHLTKATLIGHSFGGIVGTLFAEKNPSKVHALVLVGAPVSLQETFTNIISRSKTIYQDNQDDNNLKYIGMLEQMDKTSLPYSSYCFGHAMQNGFYFPKAPTKEALGIYAKLQADTTFRGGAAKMTMEAPKGFWENESYTTIDMTQNLKNAMKNGTPVFAMYGVEDGLYSKEQVMEVEQLVSTSHFKYFENCSHNVFMDQQEAFMVALKTWIK